MRERELERILSATPRMREPKVSLVLALPRRCRDIEGETVWARLMGCGKVWGKDVGVSERSGASMV